ncbi:MAG: SDR family NAD(P)-dependent oxidoreductase [Candidatus Eisenbacteria bacterium]
MTQESPVAGQASRAESATVLVTGGAGFIGSHIVDRLVALGHRVRVLDNLHAGRVENLASVRDRIELRIGDLRDRAAVDQAVAGSDIVVHMGGNASVPESVADRTYDFEANALGSFNVADAMVRHQVRRIVFASSAAVYGPPRYTPVDEATRSASRSPYGGSKVAAERTSSLTHAPSVSRWQCSASSTPTDRASARTSPTTLARSWRATRIAEVLGDGEQRRDYSFVSDTLSPSCWRRPRPSKGRPWNVAGGRAVSIRELVGAILTHSSFETPK